jgi:hypothetical protein
LSLAQNRERAIGFHRGAKIRIFRRAGWLSRVLKSPHCVRNVVALAHSYALPPGDVGEWSDPLAKYAAKLAIGGIAIALLAGPVTPAVTQSMPAAGLGGQPAVTGLWQKINEETGNSAGWFLFVTHDGLYDGAIAKMFLTPSENQNPICSACKDDRRDQPLLGLPLIRDMRRDGLVYEGGNILDPRDGNVYNPKMTVRPDGQTLTVRGYLGIALFGRDEIWHRLPDTALKELDPVVVARYLPGVKIGAAMTAARHPEKTAKSGNPVR